MTHPVLEEIARRAEGRPIYLACGSSVPPWASDQITDLLHCKRPGMRIVNSCGRYPSGAAWCARWPKERDRYGGMIVLTVAEPQAEDEPATGAGIPGGHILGEHAAQEVGDLVKLGRPVAWLACFGGQRRFVSRFSLELATLLATGHWARLFKCADAEPFIPVIGNLSPFVLVRILT
jgi:hypothetical protein